MPETLETTEIETTAREIDAQCRRSVDQGMPVFLLVFYRHENQKLALLETLRRLLEAGGLTTQTLDPRHRPEQGAGHLYDVVAASGPRCISLLFDLPLRPEGLGYDPDFLAYLNLHRDRIAKEKLRLVLLLPSTEADLFTRVAGDLWDFRQHTWWLETGGEIRGDGLWRELSIRTKELPLSPEQKIEIDEQCERVRALASETEEPEDRAALLRDLAAWLGRRYVATLALEVALGALAESPRLSPRLLAEIEHEIGYALQISDRPAEALTHYERSLEARLEAGNGSGKATTLNNISEIYSSWGQLEVALRVNEVGPQSARRGPLRSGTLFSQREPRSFTRGR